MLTQTHLSDQRLVAPARWALVSGLTGLLANVLLVTFFLLAEPFGVSGPMAEGASQDFGWLGPANDWVIAVQFLTFVPVVVALRRWLPDTRPVRVASYAAVGAMLATVVLQLLLISGALDFNVQVLLVAATFLVVFGWVLAVSSTGHRHGTLPRTVTRFGLLLGISYPVGLVISAASLIFGWGSPAQLALLVPGVVLGAAGWLGLPVWPLLLARSVFSAPPSSSSTQKGIS